MDGKMVLGLLGWAVRRTGEGRAVRPVMVSVLLGLAALALAGSDASARTEFTPHGGSGDIENAGVCPKGEYIIGFTGRAGAWLDRIGLVCGAILPDGTVGPSSKKSLGAIGGGGGGVPIPTSKGRCKAGEIIKQINYFLTHDNRMVLRIIPWCFDVGSAKPKYYLLGVGGTGAEDGGGDKFQNPCPGGEAAIGLQVRWGKHVNAVGLICDTLTIPKEKPPPFKPTQAIGTIFCQGGGMPLVGGPLNLSIGFTFKAAPQSSKAAIPARGECAWSDRPIGPNEPRQMFFPITKETKPLAEAAQKGGIFLVHVGLSGGSFWVTSVDSVNVGFVPGAAGQGGAGQGSGAGQGGGGAVAARSFAGQWNATADGVSYSMTMTAQGGVINGTFRGADGSNGKFSGAPKGNILRFSWDQTDGNRGTGKFVLSADGKSFRGSYNFGSNPDAVEGAWIGTKK